MTQNRWLSTWFTCDMENWSIRDYQFHYFTSLFRKKKILQTKLSPGSIDERQLYHGTEHNIIDSICRQNFDFRLCGKNATVCGKGSYFARDASYSHRYTTSDGTSTQYMFVADVLVGRFTKVLFTDWSGSWNFLEIPWTGRQLSQYLLVIRELILLIFHYVTAGYWSDWSNWSPSWPDLTSVGPIPAFLFFFLNFHCRIFVVLVR